MFTVMGMAGAFGRTNLTWSSRWRLLQFSTADAHPWPESPRPWAKMTVAEWREIAGNESGALYILALFLAGGVKYDSRRGDRQDRGMNVEVSLCGNHPKQYGVAYRRPAPCRSKCHTHGEYQPHSTAIATAGCPVSPDATAPYGVNPLICRSKINKSCT